MMVDKSIKFTSYILMFLILLLVFIVHCGEPEEDAETDISTSEEKKVDEETGEIKDIPTLPIDEFVKEFKGKRIIKDEYTQYDYIYVELDDTYWTLWTIADLLLDDPFKWPILAEYNNIKEPRKIYDGTEIRIPIRKLYGLAELTYLHNKVLYKLKTSPDWSPAGVGESLCVGDGVRTLNNSEAVIEFYDGSELRLSENSLIFIANISESIYDEETTSKINLERGTMNVEKKKLDPSEVFEVKTTKTKVHASKEGELSFVDFRIKEMREEDKTLVMSYEGDIDVEAMNEIVTLTSGEGSKIEKDEKPEQPIKLPPAPEITSPIPDENFNYSNISFSWKGNEGHYSYRLEFAKDREFSNIIKVYNDYSDTELEETFPEGRYYFRLCAVDEEGFEGYWSKTVSFIIADSVVDEDPPQTEVSFVGGEPVRASGNYLISGELGLVLMADDDASGVDEIIYSIDGGDERTYSKPIYLSPGVSRVNFYAVDRYGRVERENEITVVVDSDEPETMVVAK